MSKTLLWLKNSAFMLAILFMVLGCNSGGGSSNQAYYDDGYYYEEDYYYEEPEPETPRLTEELMLTMTNHLTLASTVNASNVGIGVIDGGANADHVEFEGRLFEVGYDYDSFEAAMLAEGFEQSTLNYWLNTLDHGSHVSAISGGKDVGIAQDAYIFSSINPWISINKELIGCSDVSMNKEELTYSCQMTQMIADSNNRGFGLADGGISVFNWSFTYYNGLLYQVAAVSQSQIDSYELSGGSASSETSEFSGVALGTRQDGFGGFDFTTQGVVHQLRDLLTSTANDPYERVVVVAAGNGMSGASYSDYWLQKWYENKALYPDNPLIQATTSIFEDTGEGGLAESFLFVINGFVDPQNGNLEHSLSSNVPGSKPEVQARFVLAPGSRTSSLSYDWDENGVRDDYGYMGGTSQSAPLVSGAIAILRALHPTKTPVDIANAILDSANRNFPNYDPYYHGMGLMDVEAAHALLSQ